MRMQTTPTPRWYGLLGGLVLAAAVVAVSAVSIGNAFEAQRANTVFENATNVTVNNDAGAVPVVGLLEPEIGSATDVTSNLTALTLSEDLVVSGSSSTTGTTTWGVLRAGTLSGSTTTAATSTGVLVRVRNTGGPKMCWMAGASIDTDQSVNPGQFKFSVGTSTDGLQYAGTSSGLMGTTTFPTSTDAYVSTTSTFPALAYNVGLADATLRPPLFPLANGDWVILKWETAAGAVASSTDFATMASRLDVQCFVK